MRRTVQILLLCLLLLALAAGLLWWKGIIPRRPARGVANTTSEPLMPELSLSVNGTTETTLPPGTPLVFELMFRNGAATRAELDTVASEGSREELDESVQSGKLTQQQADERLRKTKVHQPVPPILVTVAAGTISFVQEGPAGDTEFHWPVKMVEPAASSQVSLDAKQVANATFVVSPEDSRSLARGNYRLRARFENSTGRSGQWQGQVVSDPVDISIVEEHGPPTAERKEDSGLLLVQYFLALKNYDRALSTVDQLLAQYPQSVDGLSLLGTVQEAKGDFRSALAAYENAYQEFYRRNPKPYEPPWTLMRDVRRMQKKLGIELPAKVQVVAPKGKR